MEAAARSAQSSPNEGEVVVKATTLAGMDITEMYSLDAMVGGLKTKIADKLEVDKIMVSLIFNADLLNDEQTLREQGVSADCSMTVVSKTVPELSDYEQRHNYWCAANRVDFNQAIHKAAGTNDVEALCAELGKGVSPSVSGRSSETPLHHATRLGCLDTAMMLVESGANVDARNSYGNTVLQYACFRHPFDEKDHGGVPKDEIACMVNRSAVLILMILAGADVEAGGDGGVTSHQRLGSRDTGATVVLKNKDAIYANGLATVDKLKELLEQTPELSVARASFALLLERFEGAGYAWASRMLAKRPQPVCTHDRGCHIH
mmetsp:Transcript_47245/g.88513  ORF Transcript_47245/g.88513 Transcript_47245/m.88513 type:complete len:319 (-) Transcript_47245:28-984(-)